MLQVLTYTQPDAARDVLYWRHSTLDLARERETYVRATRGHHLNGPDW